MKHINFLLLILLPIILLVTLYYKSATTSNTKIKNEPATLTAIAGTDIQQITLTAKAAERLGIETVAIREGKVASSSGTNTRLAHSVVKTVPYSSIIYDLQGTTWLYTQKQPLVFIRESISVDYIDNSTVFLSAGPPVGTKVVTIGVSELYGIETGIGK